MGSVDKQPASEPIAIIGLSCKFAGDASTPEGLWRMLAEGRDAWSEIPSSRFNAKGAYHPDSEKLSTVSSSRPFISVETEMVSLTTDSFRQMSREHTS